MLYETLSDWPCVIDSPRLSTCLSKNNCLNIYILNGEQGLVSSFTFWGFQVTDFETSVYETQKNLAF